MTRGAKLTAAVTAGVLVLAAVLSWAVLRRPDTQFAEIVQGGTVLRRIDLSNAADQIIRIKSADGSSYNTVCIEHGTVRVSEAGCPDQTCVHMGVLRSESLPIVCLPNQLIVRFTEDSP